KRKRNRNSTCRRLYQSISRTGYSQGRCAMSKGRFITIEGSEGAGKTTALSFVRDFLAPQYNAVITREPGGTEIAEAIRQVLLHPTATENILPETELLLMFA